MSNPMAQYMVKDPQGNVYGPASVATLRDWITEGRIIATMQIAPQGTNEWIVVASHPELADLFKTAAAASEVSVAARPNPYQAGSPQPVQYQTPLSPVPSGTNGFAIAALVCGLIGCLMSLPGRSPCCCCMGFVPSLLGVIFGFVGYRQLLARGPNQGGLGMAKAGIILGAIGLLLIVVWGFVDMPKIIKAFNAAMAARR